MDKLAILDENNVVINTIVGKKENFPNSLIINNTPCSKGSIYNTETNSFILPEKEKISKIKINRPSSAHFKFKQKQKEKIKKKYKEPTNTGNFNADKKKKEKEKID